MNYATSNTIFRTTVIKNGRAVSGKNLSAQEWAVETLALAENRISM
jgi:hypothetical protein